MEAFLAEISTGASPLAQGARLGLLALACAAVYLVTRLGLVRVIRRLAVRTVTTWDDALVSSEVFRRLAFVVPAIVAHYGVHLSTDTPLIVTIIERASLAVMVLVAVLAFGAVLSALNAIYATDAENRHRPIKGYLQVIKIVAYVLAGLSIFSILLDRSPWIFVSGIGAMSAVLLLIFKDTILSLVASVQITSNDMVHVGDWIEMPKYGADGDVIDVALHTVKVQNWDKTITTVPTHALIADSFKNWRGMSRSGGRRIKRAVHFDVNSIRFLEPEEIERLGEWALLRDYMREKKVELDAFNHEAGRNPALRADVRSLTNIGTLRAYIKASSKRTRRSTKT